MMEKPCNSRGFGSMPNQFLVVLHLPGLVLIIIRIPQSACYMYTHALPRVKSMSPLFSGPVGHIGKVPF